MTTLARWCFRHKFRVLAIWVVALFVIGGLSAGAGSGYTDSFSLPGTESTTALNLLKDNFNTESTDTNQVVFAASDVTAPPTKTQIQTTLAAIAKGPHIERVDSPFATGAAARQIAKDKTVAFANVHMDGEQPIADVPKSAYDKLMPPRRPRAVTVWTWSWAVRESSRPPSSRAAGRASSSALSPRPSCWRSRSARCGRRCCRCSPRCWRWAAASASPACLRM